MNRRKENELGRIDAISDVRDRKDMGKTNALSADAIDKCERHHEYYSSTQKEKKEEAPK